MLLLAEQCPRTPVAYYTVTVKHLAKVPSAFCSFTTSADHLFRTASISFSVNCKANLLPPNLHPTPPHAVKPDPLPLLQTATPQTFQIKNGSSCSRPCVLGASRRFRQPEWDLEEACEGGCRGKKTVRDRHAAAAAAAATASPAVRVFGIMSSAGDRRAAGPAGRPGERSAQSERHVPRSGGADGGHPAHTGGGCGSGLRHLLFIPLSFLVGSSSKFSLSFLATLRI